MKKSIFTNIPFEIVKEIMCYLQQSKCYFKNNNKIILCKSHYNEMKKICCLSSYFPRNYGFTCCHLKPIHICLFHGNSAKKNMVEVLNSLKSYHNQGLHKRCVHFENESICKSSIKYVREYGIISHLCCDNSGIVFIGNDEMVNSFV